MYLGMAYLFFQFSLFLRTLRGAKHEDLCSLYASGEKSSNTPDLQGFCANADGDSWRENSRIVKSRAQLARNLARRTDGGREIYFGG
jgi:hypothetical protein